MYLCEKLAEPIIPRRGDCMMKISKVAFTLIELLIVISVIAILAAILFPVFAHVRDKGRQSVCISNLRQIGIAFKIYQHDYDNERPLQIDRLAPTYISAPNLFICPSDPWKNYGNRSGLSTIFPTRYPNSYIDFSGYVKEFWDFLEERQSKSGFVFDVLHGEKHHIELPDSLPYYHGLTLRLNVDGSVVPRVIVYRNDALFDAWTLANYNPGEPLPDDTILKK